MINVGNIPNKLPGRHKCECQGRVHALVRNCLGCGRIVCEQEGSGPCVFCGKFVCTREERAIIEKDKQKGLSLERQIMKQAGYGSDMARLKQEQEAKNYRDVLLKADRESIVRNKVFDLDSDYYSVESANFLTTEEKRAIQKRKEELKRLSSKRANRKMVIELDFASGTVTETNRNEQYEKVEDEVIQGILRKAEERQATQRNNEYVHRDKNLPTANKFVPKINRDLIEAQIPAANQFEFTDVYVDKDQAYAEVERQAYFLAFPQPLASEIVSGKKWYIPFDTEISIEGPVYLISRQNEQAVDSKLPEFSIIGKVILSSCITICEFHEENPDNNEESELPFVLTFEDPIQLETPLPYVTSAPFGRLPKSMREVLNK